MADANTLTLDIDDVLTLSDTTNELVVSGDASDTIDSNDTWTLTGNRVIGADTFNEYSIAGINATLIVDQDIVQAGLV